MTDYPITKFFPVYDHIYNQIKQNKDVELTKDEKISMMSHIRNLDKEATNTLFLLIRIHGLRFSNDKAFDIPFNGVPVKAGSPTSVSASGSGPVDIEFNINKLPTCLNQILYRFIQMHLHKLQVEQERNAVASDCIKKNIQ